MQGSWNPGPGRCLWAKSPFILSLLGLCEHCVGPRTGLALVGSAGQGHRHNKRACLALLSEPEDGFGGNTANLGRVSEQTGRRGNGSRPSFPHHRVRWTCRHQHSDEPPPFSRGERTSWLTTAAAVAKRRQEDGEKALEPISARRGSASWREGCCNDYMVR
jgi:hypothetical protein